MEIGSEINKKYLNILLLLFVSFCGVQKFFAKAVSGLGKGLTLPWAFPLGFYFKMGYQTDIICLKSVDLINL